MRGDLSESTAADVCRGLATTGRTGTLTISGVDGPGSVSFVQGRIVAAVSPAPRARLGDRLVGAGYLRERDLAEALAHQQQTDDRPRLGALLVDQGLISADAVRLFAQEQVIDALFDLLRSRFGSYEFHAGVAVPADEVPLDVPVDDLLVEVARRQHEWDDVSRVIPDLEAVPTFPAGASSATAALEPDEFAVLASVDGHRSVRRLAADLGYGEFEVARIVYALTLLGVVEVRLPEDEIGAALDDALSWGGDTLHAGDRVVASDVDAEVDPVGAALDEARSAPPAPGDPVQGRAWTPRIVRPEDPPPAADTTDADEFPAAPDGDEVVAAELDDRALRTMLAELTGARAPTGPEPTQPAEPAGVPDPVGAAEPTGTAAPAAAASTDDDPGDHHAGDDPGEDPGDDPGDPEAAAGDPPADRRAEGDDNTDVSEFLRELSRLALGSEDEGHPPARRDDDRPRDPGPRRSEPDDKGRKRRGLFGWGG